MSAATDTFVAFVDVLADALDDHETTGDALAARLNLLLKMVEHHVCLTGEMVERAARLSDEALDKPIVISVEGVDDDPTLRKLLSRLVGQLGMWDVVLSKRDYDWSVEEHEAVDSMRRRLAVEGPTFLEDVRTVSEEGGLDETFVDAHCQPADVFTHGGMIAHVLTFAAHRRTLVPGALIDAGIGDLGAGDPRLWVADAA